MSVVAVAVAAAAAAEEVAAVTTASGHPKQPASSSLFRFVRGQDINSTFFSCKNNNNNINQDDSPTAAAPPAAAAKQQQQEPHSPKPFLLTGQLVWVCKSKGLKRNNKKRRRRGDENNEENQQQQQHQRLEAFLRARIVHGDNEEYKKSNNENKCNDKAKIENSNSNRHSDMVAVDPEDDDDRVLVRYPKGSTYMVKRSHLWPVLEQDVIRNNMIKNNNKKKYDDDDDETTTATLVLVFAETNFYRRACMVHTLPDGADIFWEIGCDAGSTIHKVATTLNSCSNNNNDNDNDDTDLTTTTTTPCCLRVLGIDKSQESIDEARRLYPNLPFCMWDILAEKKDSADTKVGSSSGNNNYNGDAGNVLFASSLEQAIQDALVAVTTTAIPKTTTSSLSTPAPKGTGIMRQQQHHTSKPLLSPTVVAIDINGNRELPAVLECLNKVSSIWKPRLILVKSRALHYQLSLPQVEDAKLVAMMMAC